MVQLRSKLTVLDNTGVKQARVIQVLRTRRRHGVIGDQVVAVVVKANSESPMKKGDVVRGYLATSIYGRQRATGIRVNFDVNGLILVNKKQEPLATRVRAPLPAELRRKGRGKRLSRSAHVV
jgi:ribosomal protein L14